MTVGSYTVASVFQTEYDNEQLKWPALVVGAVMDVASASWRIIVRADKADAAVGVLPGDLKLADLGPTKTQADGELETSWIIWNASDKNSVTVVQNPKQFVAERPVVFLLMQS